MLSLLSLYTPLPCLTVRPFSLEELRFFKLKKDRQTLISTLSLKRLDPAISSTQYFSQSNHVLQYLYNFFIRVFSFYAFAYKLSFVASISALMQELIYVLVSFTVIIKFLFLTNPLVAQLVRHLSSTYINRNQSPVVAMMIRDLSEFLSYKKRFFFLSNILF